MKLRRKHLSFAQLPAGRMKTWWHVLYSWDLFTEGRTSTVRSAFMTHAFLEKRWVRSKTSNGVFPRASPPAVHDGSPALPRAPESRGDVPAQLPTLTIAAHEDGQPLGDASCAAALFAAPEPTVLNRQWSSTVILSWTRTHVLFFRHNGTEPHGEILEETVPNGYNKHFRRKPSGTSAGKHLTNNSKPLSHSVSEPTLQARLKYITVTSAQFWQTLC